MFNYNAPWHPLKKVMLGRTYSPEFYSDIKNSKIRNVLQRIAYETNEDYDNIEKVLRSHGIDVVRPELAPDSIMNHINDCGQLTSDNAKSWTLVPRPPMQARDSILIVGDQAVSTNQESFLFDSSITECAPLKFDAPYVTVIGDRLFVDRRDCPTLDQYICQRFTDRKVIPVDIGGHNDAVFAPVGPGLIISTYYHTNYQDTFPNWEVLYIANQSWNAVTDWRKLKHSNAGKWWMPGEESNDEFTNFVETWLSHWLGYVEETVFDVNMLMLDENTVIVNNYNKQVFDFLEKHHIIPIITPFRHRFFWDGGIHCITNDFYREGAVESYL